jgi:hypothetical protein
MRYIDKFRSTYESRMPLLRGLAGLSVSFRLGRPAPAKCAVR